MARAKTTQMAKYVAGDRGAPAHSAPAPAPARSVNNGAAAAAALP